MTTDYAALYKALELSPGAQPEEVKRAYFRLVRKYSPESHPEEFKRIRAAYEALKDGTPQQDEEFFQPPSDPLLQIPLEQAARYVQTRDYASAASLYENMLDLVPDDPCLLLGLANAQRLGGHPQKAAKTALRLTELRPDSRDAWRVASMETYSRGWYKKALPLFRKAYSLGEKRLDFLTDYAAAARDNREFQESDRVNREILQTEKWTKDNVEYGAQAYLSLAERACTPKEAIWMLDSYAAFLPGCRRLPLDVDDLTSPLAALYYQADYLMEDLDVYRKADHCLALIVKIRNTEKFSFPDKLRIKLLFEAIYSDKRFHNPAWPGLVEATFMESELFPHARYSPEVKTFATLDTRICLLKQDLDMFRQDAALLESAYPYLYEPNREFIEEALTGDREALFSRLKRQFLKMYHKFNGSNFQNYYPEELPAAHHAVKVHSGEKPYMRSGKKTGRNDPCPCGSGKKFKRCCMGKGIYD